MTDEYNFFKQFAGVTKEDLEALKCGGKMKKKAIGGALAAGKIGGLAGKMAKKLKSKLTSKSSGPTHVTGSGEGEADTIYTVNDRKPPFITKELNTGNMLYMYKDNKGRPVSKEEWDRQMKRVTKKR